MILNIWTTWTHAGRYTSNSSRIMSISNYRPFNNSRSCWLQAKWKYSLKQTWNGSGFYVIHQNRADRFQMKRWTHFNNQRHKNICSRWISSNFPGKAKLDTSKQIQPGFEEHDLLSLVNIWSRTRSIWCVQDHSWFNHNRKANGLTSNYTAKLATVQTTYSHINAAKTVTCICSHISASQQQWNSLQTLSVRIMTHSYSHMGTVKQHIVTGAVKT